MCLGWAHLGHSLSAWGSLPWDSNRVSCLLFLFSWAHPECCCLTTHSQTWFFRVTTLLEKLQWFSTSCEMRSKSGTNHPPGWGISVTLQALLCSGYSPPNRVSPTSFHLLIYWLIKEIMVDVNYILCTMTACGNTSMIETWSWTWDVSQPVRKKTVSVHKHSYCQVQQGKP